MRLAFWRKGKAEVVEIDVTGTIQAVANGEPWNPRAYLKFPHCDSLVLHSPGACEFCDLHPGWQALRSAQGIAFTDMSEEDRVKHDLLPCPSTYRRPPEVRDRWPGNTARGPVDPPPASS